MIHGLMWYFSACSGLADAAARLRPLWQQQRRSSSAAAQLRRQRQGSRMFSQIILYTSLFAKIMVAQHERIYTNKSPAVSETADRTAYDALINDAYF